MARSAQGVTVTIELGDDELLGAHVLARMDGVASRDPTEFNRVLRSSLRHGVADRLRRGGNRVAAVRRRRWRWPTASPVSSAGEWGEGERRRFVSDGAARADAAPDATVVARTGVAPGDSGETWRSTLCCALARIAGRWLCPALVVDRLLRQRPAVGLDAPAPCSPVVLATFPLWLGFSRYMSPARRRTLGAAVLVFAVFVLIGYVNPLDVDRAFAGRHCGAG